MAAIGSDILEHLKQVYFYYWQQHDEEWTQDRKDYWEAQAEDVAAIISFYLPEWTP